MFHENEDLIGRTTFLYKGQESVIRIYKPTKKWEIEDELSCRFSIEAGDIKYTGENIGFDSMHAIILALSSIGQYLKDNDAIKQQFIEWPGGAMEFPSF